MFLYDNQIVQQDMVKILAEKTLPYDKLKNKTVLVTGANGMIARYFIYLLMYLNLHKEMNITVIALVRNKEKAVNNFSGFLANPQFQLLEQDVCETLSLKVPVQYILHAAGCASPRFINNDPVGIIRANTIGTMNVLDFARKNPIENLIYTSTREIYGSVEQKEFIEEKDMGILSNTEERSCYPESKRLAEQIFVSYNRQYGVPYNILRIAHTYGPGMCIDQDGRIMSDLVSNIVNNHDIILNSDGSAVRAFCYLSDTISAILTVMLKGRIGEAYNVSNELEPLPILKLAQLLITLFPEKCLKIIVNADEHKKGYCNYKRVELSTEKIRSLGWKPRTSLNEGLVNTVRSFY